LGLFSNQWPNVLRTFVRLNSSTFFWSKTTNSTTRLGLVNLSGRFTHHTNLASFAIFAVIRRASSLLTNLAADRRPGSVEQ
jgi:hypothetical protein